MSLWHLLLFFGSSLLPQNDTADSDRGEFNSPREERKQEAGNRQQEEPPR